MLIFITIITFFFLIMRIISLRSEVAELEQENNKLRRFMLLAHDLQLHVKELEDIIRDK